MTIDSIRQELVAAIAKVENHMETIDVRTRGGDIAYNLNLEEKEAYYNVLHYINGDRNSIFASSDFEGEI
jgi:hypothetical protein